MWRIRRFFRKIKDIFEWIPVIWKDEEWDDSYIYDILLYKIKRVRRHHEKRMFFVGVEKEIQNMKDCEYILQRLVDDDYSFNYWDDRLNKKYGESEVSFDKVDGSKYYTLNIDRPRVMTDQDKKDEFKMIRRRMDLEKYLKDQDKYFLYKSMKRHWDSWWD